MFTHLEEVLLSYATAIPLELFAFTASVFEEIVAPIPSPTIMLVTGSLAFVEGRPLFALVPLAFLGALGKTFGASGVYLIADKAEDFVIRRFGSFFNVTSADVEQLGKKIGTGARGYAVLTFLRALPFMPSTIISVGSGILRIPIPMFIVSTFLGTVLRDGFYLYAGYAGTHVLTRTIARADSVEIWIEIAVVLSVLGYLGYRIYKKRMAS